MAKYQQYKEYKDSGVEWLGDVPKHWLITTFKRVIKEHSGNGFPIELQGDESGVIPFLKVSDINGTNKYSDRCNNRISNDSLNKYGWNLVPRGSIVTGKIGEALRKNHRKILSEDSVIDNNCIGIEPIHLTENYNFYVHKVIDFDWYVNGGAIPSISVQKYKAEVIAIPNENEQIQIANFLDHETTQIDSLIEKQQLLIELLKEKRQAVISHAVTKGLNPNVPMKDSGVEWLGQVPEHWTISFIKYILAKEKDAMVDGPFGSSVNTATDYVEEGIPVIRTVNITNDGFSSDNLKFMRPAKFEELKRHSVKPRDVLFSKVGTIGNACIFPENIDVGILSTTGSCKISININLIDREFLVYQIHSMNQELMQIANANVQPFLNMTNIKNLRISLPPLAEQQLIINLLKKRLVRFDELISKAQSAIQLMQERRTALISAAVTGKIDVRNWQDPTEAKMEFSA
ncbi:restriction endonuclease subunit S [Acinetobacter sp. ANC 4277]|uniref:restriction endonuclease subunit S n=1 Tax=Acinetobacter terrae TaxID=2731247 RepID=UPI00148FA4FE|nr:restriction endonuclease subunit S [Acinetobacter terrae]NNG75057.1 restriction endonuclease subunit S [Acinetobacter terrae]